MTNYEKFFRAATCADKCGTVVFFIVFIVSTVLLIPDHRLEDIGHPILIVMAILAVACTIFTTIYQTEGNRALRSTQLGDALGAQTGDGIREDYYNNALPRDLRRLAATTLENTLFSKAILSRMAIEMRFKLGAYFVILVWLLAARSTPSGWLLTLAQTLFSADLVLKCLRLERFRIRASRVNEKFEQFFQQTGDPNRANDMAILISGFTDYECAKDEAAIPLDDKIFKKLNPELSEEWNKIKTRLNIP